MLSGVIGAQSECILELFSLCHPFFKTNCKKTLLFTLVKVKAKHVIHIFEILFSDENGYHFGIKRGSGSERIGMRGYASHNMCPRYSGPQTLWPPRPVGHGKPLPLPFIRTHVEYCI